MPNGCIVANTTDTQILEGPRPKSAIEFGGDEGQLLSLNQRVPGTAINTRARGGCGVGAFARLDAFKNTAEFSKRFSVSGDTEVLICVVRDPCAPGSVGMDVANGIQAHEDPFFWGIMESVEIGLHTSEGWGRFLLPVELARYQDRFDHEQLEVWKSIAPDISRGQDIRLTIKHVRADSLNGIPCILSTEKTSVEVVQAIDFYLEGDGWMVIDTELLPNGSPLGRGISGICLSRQGPPLIISLGKEGFDSRFPVGVYTPAGLGITYNAKVKSVMNAIR
ncbi:MAG: hypothetical protein K0S20_286 [Patescibacteria group bacterium]|nr:hypothetical protein [Patescibacteria group bacterium]